MNELFTYEFMNKCQFPVPAREYAVVFGAVAGGELQLLKSSGTYNMSFSTAGTMNSPISVGEIDIIKKKKSWWMVGEKFGLNNKVKEVSFKI